MYRKMKQNRNRNVVRFNEAQLKKIVSESVRKMMKENMKQTITSDQAGSLLLKGVDDGNFEDRIYEFAMDLCDARINAIEAKYDIVGYDGEPYTDEDDVAWYDEYRDEFVRAVFERLGGMTGR